MSKNNQASSSGLGSTLLKLVGTGLAGGLLLIAGAQKLGEKIGEKPAETEAKEEE